MGKSALYVSNITPGPVTAGSALPLGVAVHGFGCGIRKNGDSIVVGHGYYDVEVSVTLTATTSATPSTVALYQDGNPVTGAYGVETATAVGDSIDIAFPAIVRVGKCGASVLTVELVDGSATLDNLAVKVVQI